MITFIKVYKSKINGIIYHLITTGILLLFLGILVVWTDFMVRLVMGVFILVIAYLFFYLSYKLWAFKKALEKHFKI